MKKRSLALVLLFPAVLLIWMVGWCMYVIGDRPGQSRDRRPDESYWTWFRRMRKA
jgi:uncharacterized membrane protein